MCKVETHNALKYIKDGLEYLLLIGVIIECNSLYRHYSGHSLQAGLFLEGAVLSVLLLLLLVRIVQERRGSRSCWKTLLVFIFVEALGIIFSFVNDIWGSANGLVVYYVKLFIVFMPLMIINFRMDIKAGEPYQLWFKYTDIVFGYSLLCLLVYVVIIFNKTYLGIETIHSAWTGDERTFFSCVLTVNPMRIGPVNLFRDFGVFTEPLMYCVPLLTSLYTELFLRVKQLCFIRVLVFSLALLSTGSTLGILIEMLAWGLFACRFIRGKWKLWIYTGFGIGACFGALLVYKKYQNTFGSLGSSFNAHMYDYLYAVRAFLAKPWTGWGFDNDDAIRAFMPAERLAENGGLSNTITVVAAHGGILLLLICTVPYLLLMLKGTSKKYRGILCWGVGVFSIYVVTIIYYHFYMLMVMAFGYAWLWCKVGAPATEERQTSVKREVKLWIPITGFMLALANLWGLVAEKHYIAFVLGALLLAAIVGGCALWMSVKHKYQKVAVARILTVLLLFEGVLMIYNNILLTLHQLMYRHGLLMSQRLMGLPLFVAGYIVCMQLLQYLWDVRRNRGLLIRTCVRLVVSGIVTIVLMRWKGAWLLTLFQMMGWWTDTMMLVVPAIAMVLIYTLLYAMEYSFFRRRVKRKNRYQALALFAISSCLCFALTLYGNTYYKENREEYEEFVQWNDELIAELVSVSTGDVFSNYLPELFAEYHDGLQALALSDSQCRDRENTTILTNIDYDTEYLGRYGYMVAKLSDLHLVYTNDASVIAWLQTREYPVSRTPILVQDLNMGIVALRNELESSGTGGVMVQGSLASILHGPFVALDKGEYQVIFDLTADGDLSQPDAVIAQIRVSANNGEVAIKEQNVTVSELSEDGSAQIAVTFSTDDATGVEFIFRGMDGWRTVVHDITYINVPGYETVRTYDRSNRVVREEYYDLSGNPMLHAEGYYAKTMEYEWHGYVAREYYYGLDGNLIANGMARRDFVYDYDGLLMNCITYDSNGQILTEIDDSYFLRDLERYRNDADYTIFLAVKDEAASKISTKARKYFKKNGLIALSMLEYRESYLGILNGYDIVYEERESKENQISYIKDNYAIRSAGLEAGDLASIVIDGREYAKNQRGINMVVYDTVAGEVVYSGVYDTCQYQLQVP